jgi:hypothetical protein
LRRGTRRKLAQRKARPSIFLPSEKKRRTSTHGRNTTHERKKVRTSPRPGTTYVHHSQLPHRCTSERTKVELELEVEVELEDELEDEEEANGDGEVAL